MKRDTERHAQVEYELSENHPIRLSDARAQRIECLSGVAWVTVAGEHSDFMLRAGQTFTVPSDGLTLIEAVGSGRVRVRPPVARSQPWYRRWLPFAGKPAGACMS